MYNEIIVKSQVQEECDSILPDISDPDCPSMSTENNHGPLHRAVAPKRTINEAGTIVLTTATEGEPSNMLDNTLEEEETPSKRRKSSNRGGKKFRQEWLAFDMFKGWLRAHPNPERAMCTGCNIILNAGKSELEKHATSIKHQKKMLEFKRQQQHNIQYEAETPQNVILTVENHDPEDAMGSSFLQRQDHLEVSSFTPEGSYLDQQVLGVEISGSQMAGGMSSGRSKTTETPSYNSKAVVTKPAPPWKATAIVNGHVTRLELNDYKGRYLILFFYPQDFSAVCPTELLALSDRVQEFRVLQTEIVACSVDSHLTHLAWARTPRTEGGLGNPKIPLLADPTHSIARDYGVLLPDLGHSLRAHFIIDRRGILRHMLVNDLGVGRSIDELLRVTQALQHVDETETGCPADWKPGLPSV